MAGFSVPIGVRFQPTKLQLVQYFLATKLSGHKLRDCYHQFIEFDIYSDHPFNILASTKERRGVDNVNEGYFFTRLHKITPNGKRINRYIKDIGTWSEKSMTNTVSDRNGVVVGIEKYLKFTSDVKSKNEIEGEWTMHEYYHNASDEIVLCHITRKPQSCKDGSALKRSCHYAMIPLDHEDNANKRGRIEYEQPSSSGCNNTSGIHNPNQDYVLSDQVVNSSYLHQGTDEYCHVPQVIDNSAFEEAASKDAFADELEGMLDVEVHKDNADNQAYEVDGGVLQLSELNDHQVYDMEPLQVQDEHGLSVSIGAQEGIVDVDQFLKEAEQAYWLPNGEQDNTSGSLENLWTGCDNSTNGFGLDDLDLSTLNGDVDWSWLLDETPITTA